MKAALEPVTFADFWATLANQSFVVVILSPISVAFCT
jgi:hypothetical protein